MNTPRHLPHALRSMPVRLLGCLALAFSAASATAVTPPGATTGLSPQARYQQDRARCAAIPGHDQRANCLSEASTRYARSLPPVPSEAAALLEANAFKRCDPLPEPDRRDCVARMKGEGTTSGSVATGGIYRELVTREVGQPDTTKEVLTQ
jgi:hypothetical protein